jgi:hypothetical protein
MAGYEYNPLLPLNLQKRSAVSPSDIQHLEQEIASINEDITDINGDLKKKVPKFFTSIEELEVGEIGQYQGETTEEFTHGYFYQRGEGINEFRYVEEAEVTIVKRFSTSNYYQTLLEGNCPTRDVETDRPPLYFVDSYTIPGVSLYFYVLPLAFGIISEYYVDDDVLFNRDSKIVNGYLLPFARSRVNDVEVIYQTRYVNNVLEVNYNDSWLIISSFDGYGYANAVEHIYSAYIYSQNKLCPCWFYNLPGSAISFYGLANQDMQYSIWNYAGVDIFTPNILSLWTNVSIQETLYLPTYINIPAITRIDTQPSLDPSDFATSDQGAKADTALQSISVGTDGKYITTNVGSKDAHNNQTVGVSAKIQDIATADNDNKGFAESSDVKAYAATAAQGAKADTALQSISHGTDGNYVTSHIGTKDANNVQTVDVSLQLQAVESADVSHKGVAEANDVKEYVAKSISSYIPYNPIYGVMWDTSDPSPECVRIGNLDLHRTLPVQSQMVGGTLTDAGVFTPFASVDDWTSETRDGSAGQVMVRLPQYFWIKFITEGSFCKVLMSAEEVSGFVKVPLYYNSAYKAALQRSTLKLASVVNTDADYRGGNNQSAWDGTYRSLLGYPATSISLTDFRTYARNRAAGTEWNCAVYEIHKLLYWLFVVEYATLNTQKDYNAALDANGYHQGGLGVGVTDWSDDAWNSFNSYYPLIPCGHTDEYGNQTAQKLYNLYGSDGTTILHSFQVPRYRGVESPFGDIWEWTDGVLIPKQADSDGGKSPVYITSDPANFSSSDYSQYDYVCDEIRNEAYIKSIHFGTNGDLICTATPGSSTSYYCDYWYGANLPSSGVSLRALHFGGRAINGARAGFVYGDSRHGPGSVIAFIGSRLCFIPNTV